VSIYPSQHGCIDQDTKKDHRTNLRTELRSTIRLSPVPGSIPQPDPTPRVLVSHSESPDLRQGFWTKRVRRMIHPSGGRRGRIIRSSLDYLTQSVKESLYRGSEIRRFTSDPYTPKSFIPCLQIRPTEFQTGPRWGGPAAPQDPSDLSIISDPSDLSIISSRPRGP
jgi:hypothetical protein